MKVFRRHFMGYALRLFCSFLLVFNQTLATGFHPSFEIDRDHRSLVLRPLKVAAEEAFEQLIAELASQQESFETKWTVYNKDAQRISLETLAALSKVANFVNQGDLFCSLEPSSKGPSLSNTFSLGALSNEGEMTFIDERYETLEKPLDVNLHIESLLNSGRVVFESPSLVKGASWTVLISNAIENKGTLQTQNQLSLLNHSKICNLGGTLEANGLTLKGFDQIRSTIISGYRRDDLRQGAFEEDLDAVPGYLHVRSGPFGAREASLELADNPIGDAQHKSFMHPVGKKVSDFLWQGHVQTTGLTTLDLKRTNGEAIDADIEAYFDTRGFKVAVSSKTPSRVDFTNNDTSSIANLEDEHSPLETSGLGADSESEATTVDTKGSRTSIFGFEGLSVSFSPFSSSSSLLRLPDPELTQPFTRGFVAFCGDYNVEGVFDLNQVHDLYIAPESIVTFDADAIIDAETLTIEGALRRSLHNKKGKFKTDADITVFPSGSLILPHLINTSRDSHSPIREDREQNLINKGFASIYDFTQNRRLIATNSGELHLLKAGGLVRGLTVRDNSGIVKSRSAIQSIFSNAFFEPYRQSNRIQKGSGFHKIPVNGTLISKEDIHIDLPKDFRHTFDWWQSLSGTSVMFGDTAEQADRFLTDLIVKGGTTLKATHDNISFKVRRLRTEKGSRLEAPRFVKFITEATDDKNFATHHGILRSPALLAKGYAFRGGGTLDIQNLQVFSQTINLDSFIFGESLNTIFLQSDGDFILDRSTNSMLPQKTNSSLKHPQSQALDSLRMRGNFDVSSNKISIKTAVISQSLIRLRADKPKIEGDSWIEIAADLKARGGLSFESPLFSFDRTTPLHLRGQNIQFCQKKTSTLSQQKFKLPPNVILKANKLSKQVGEERVFQDKGYVSIDSPYDVFLSSDHSGDSLKIKGKSLFLEGSGHKAPIRLLRDQANRHLFKGFKEIFVDCGETFRSTIPIEAQRLFTQSQHLLLKDVTTQEFDMTATHFALFGNSLLSSQESSWLACQDLRFESTSLEGSDLIFEGITEDAVHSFKDVKGAGATVTQVNNRSVFLGENTLRHLKTDHVTTVPEGSSLKVGHISIQPGQKIIDFRGSVATEQADLDLQASQRMLIHNLKRTGGCDQFDSVSLKSKTVEVQGTLNTKTGLVEGDETLRLKQAKLMGQIFYLLSQQQLSMDATEVSVTELVALAQNIDITDVKQEGDTLVLQSREQIKAVRFAADVPSMAITGQDVKLTDVDLKSKVGLIDGRNSLSLARAAVKADSFKLSGTKASIEKSILHINTLQTHTDTFVSDSVQWKGSNHTHVSQNLLETDTRYTLSGSLNILAQNIIERGVIIARSTTLKAEEGVVDLDQTEIQTNNDFKVIAREIKALASKIEAQNASFEGTGSVDIREADLRIREFGNITAHELTASAARIKAHTLRVQAETAANLTEAHIDLVTQGEFIAHDLNAHAARITADKALIQVLDTLNISEATIQVADQAELMAETLKGVNTHLVIGDLLVKATQADFGKADIHVKDMARIVVDKLTAFSSTITAKNAAFVITGTADIQKASIDIEKGLEFIIHDLKAASARITADTFLLHATDSLNLNGSVVTVRNARILAQNLEAVSAQIEADRALMKVTGVLNMKAADIKVKSRVDLLATTLKGLTSKIKAGALFVKTEGISDLSESQITVEGVTQLLAKELKALSLHLKAQSLAVQTEGTANIQNADLDIQACVDFIVKDLKAHSAKIKVNKGRFKATESIDISNSRMTITQDAAIQAQKIEAIAAYIQANTLLLKSEDTDLSSSDIHTVTATEILSENLKAGDASFQSRDLTIKGGKKTANLGGSSVTASNHFHLEGDQAELSPEKIRAKSATVHLSHYRNGIAGVIALAHDLMHCKRVRLDARNETLTLEGEVNWRPNITLALKRVEIGGTLRSSGDIAFETENGGKVTGKVYAHNFDLEAQHGDLEFYKAVLNTVENLSLKAHVGSIYGQGDVFTAGRDLSMRAANHIVESSIATRQNWGENYEDTATTSQFAAGGALETDAGGNIHFVGIKTKSGDDTLIQAGGNFTNPALALGSQRVYRSGRSMTRHTHTLHQRSEHDVGGTYSVQTNGSIEMQAPSVRAQKAIRLAAGQSVTLSDVHDSHEYEHHSHKEGGFFTSSRTIREQSYKSRSIGADLKSNDPVSIMAGKDIALTKVTVRAPRTIVNALDGVIKVLLGSHYEAFSSSEESSNFLWQSQRVQNREQRTSTASQFTGDIEIVSKETILEHVRNRSLDFEQKIHQQGGKISYILVDELYKNDIKESGGPSVALAAVISIAVAIATGGTGGIATQFGAYMTQATAAVAGTTTASVISGMSSAMLTSLCAQSAVALVANQGNIFKAAESILSVSTLKGVVFSMAAAGLTTGIMEGLSEGVAQTSDALPTFADHAQRHFVQSGVSTSLSVISGTKVEDALKQGLLSFAAGTLSATCANVIGEAGVTGDLDVACRIGLHGVVGAAAGLLVSDDPASGLISGALGAVIGEIAAEVSKPTTKPSIFASDLEQNIHREAIDSVANQSRMIAAVSALVLHADVNTADYTAHNALTHNFKQSSMNMSACEDLERMKKEAEEEWNKTHSYSALYKLQGIQEILDDMTETRPDQAIASWMIDNPEVSLSILAGGLSLGASAIAGVALASGGTLASVGFSLGAAAGVGATSGAIQHYKYSLDPKYPLTEAQGTRYLLHSMAKGAIEPFALGSVAGAYKAYYEGASISRIAAYSIMGGTMALATADQDHALHCLNNQFTSTEKAQDLFNSRTLGVTKLLLPEKGSILVGAGLLASSKYLQGFSSSKANQVFLEDVQKIGLNSLTKGILRGTERVVNLAKQKWGELPGFKEAAVCRFLMNAEPAEKPLLIYRPPLYEQHMSVD